MSTDSLFASALACADAEAQGSFFNAFYRHLKIVCKAKEQNQVCYIAEYLDENGRTFASELAEFAKLAVESRVKKETEMQQIYRDRSELEKEIAALRDQREAFINASLELTQ